MKQEKTNKTIVAIVQIIVVLAIIIPLMLVAFRNKNASQGEFVAPKERQTWIKPIAQTMDKIKSEQELDGLSGFAFSLFDVDIDGVPELAVISAGGSAGNLFLNFYDIKTQENKAAFGVGHFGEEWDGSLCVYKNDETGEYEVINISYTRGGGELRFKGYSRIEQTENGAYDDEMLFYIDYERICELENDDYQEVGVEAEYYIGREKVMLDEYQTAFDKFIANSIRIPETEIKIIKASDLEKKIEDEGFSQMLAEKLVAVEQEFVKAS